MVFCFRPIIKACECKGACKRKCTCTLCSKNCKCSDSKCSKRKWYEMDPTEPMLESSSADEPPVDRNLDLARRLKNVNINKLAKFLQDNTVIASELEGFVDNSQISISPIPEHSPTWCQCAGHVRLWQLSKFDFLAIGSNC